jgi:tetratricopeptide (TPR) repeat protein
MSRYYSFIIVMFLLAGCATKEVVVTNESTKKVFEEEDNLILQALDYQQNGDYVNARKIYHSLYEQSQKKIYLTEDAGLAFILGDSDARDLIMQGIKKYPEEKNFNRLLVGQLVKEKRYEEAEKEILKLIEFDKSVQHLSIAGNLYLQMKQYDLALKYFESAYKQDQNEDLLLNIVELLYRFLDRKDDAVAYLETYASMEGCGEHACFKLVEIYGRDRNVQGLIATYKKLYKEQQSDEIAKKIVELMMYVKDVKGATSFLEKTGFNQDVLLQIYATQKKFSEAYILAEKLYNESKNLDYLGKMAIYEYELNKSKLSAETLQSIMRKFDEVTSLLKDSVYLNYYGYLLIDHDIDIPKGITLVQEALKIEPNSPYYLDSLAWGLFKQGQCAAAYNIIQYFGDNAMEEEVIAHIDAIKKCLKEKQ